jgi:hypothetical protein
VLLSEAEFDGGVSRLPTLTDAVVGNWSELENAGYLFPWRVGKAGGAGSSKAGNVAAAGLRFVKLEGALRTSRDEPIMGATAAAARMTAKNTRRVFALLFLLKDH